jgi:hypothetical protein
MISFSENTSDHEMYFINLLETTHFYACDLPKKEKKKTKGLNGQSNNH